MPIYRVNNKSYNIPEDMAGKFEQQFPDATVDVYNGSEHYSIPVQKKNSFLKDYPEATFDYPQQNDNNNVDKWEPTNEVKEYSLNNIPDMFRSKGDNLATRPLPQQDLFENNPSDLVRKIGIDQQQRVEQAQKSANDPYMKEQNLELFKRQNQEQINSVNELINAARQERAKERQQRVRSVGDGGIFSTMSQAYLAGEQNDTDKQLEYASTLMEQAQNITNEAKKKGNTNFFAGFARGFKDAPLDGWAMGLQDLKNYSAAKKVMDKVDKGEELTPSEDALMQALVTNAATQMYYAGDLGRGYKAGGVTAESLPFMLDMIAGMGAVQALTKPASKAIVKYAADKAAQMGLGRATTGLAKGAARTVAGLGDVAAHTATFGSARVAADYQRRGLGDVQVKPNADGTVSYDGRENIQTGAEALGKSIISTAAETGSELLGEYFAPMLGYIGRVTGANKIGKIIPASVGKAFKDVVNSQGFREMQEIARRAKISDPLGEYAEEVANNLVSTAIGDMTPEQLVDLDQNIDTFLGVAPMSALFGAAGTGGYLRDKYKNYRNMRNFETQMQDAMGEDWSGVREALQDADIETARNMVKDVLSSPMSPDMKKNAIKYISSVLQEQTLQEADKQMMPEEIAVEKRNIINNLNETRSKISLNDEELNSIINSEEGYQAIISQFDPETANNIMQYKQAYDDFVNYNYWVQDQADNARRQAEAQVESLTNATTGTIMRVNNKLAKNPVNVLRGNLVFDNEGKVDENQSDKTIYYMSEDGRVKMAPVSMFSSLVDNTPAEEMIQRAGNDAQEEVLQAEEAQINSIPAQEQQHIEPETRFTMGGNNYEVNRVTPDGYEVYLLDENGTPAQSQLMSEKEIRNAINGQQPANAEETQPSVTEQTVQEETSEQPVQENQTAMSRIPLNERGEQDFEAAPVADTSAALLEISDNVDDAKDTVTQMIEYYNNELKKVEKKKSSGNTIQGIIETKKAKKAINDKISYWNQVAADLEAKMPTGLIAQAEEKAKENQQRLASMTAEEQQAAQQEVQKKIDAGAFESKEPRKKVRYVKEDADLGPSITPQEHVLREIATGRVSFSLSDTEGAQGLSSHLGYSNSPEERKKLVWTLSSDGLTPEAAAEQIHADMPENLQGMVTDQDVFNMIINAFQEYGSPSKMWDAAKNMHGTDIEENIPGYEEDQERQLIEWEASENRMSVPEWIAYSDYIEEELNNLYSSVTDEELNTILEQIINDYERRAETESAGSTEGQTDSEQGNTVQPERESDNEGRTGEVEEQPEPANKTDGESSSVVPEPEGTVDNNGYPFLKSSNETTIFGEIREETGLTPAPIKLSEGFNRKDKKGRNHGYGFKHIEESHGDQIRNYGFESIPEFVESVAKNYTIVRKGNKRNGIDTYILEVSDKKNNTLFVELSKDGSYWNVNSAGVFRKGYSKKKEVVWPLPAVEDASTAEDTGVQNATDSSNSISGNSPQNASFIDKDTQYLEEKQEDKQKFTASEINQGEGVIEYAQRIAKEKEIWDESQKVDINPTEGQKEAGNYKMGHVKVDGIDITIENPKGSVRSGKDANGKEWSVTMNNTYGYIRGTRGVDGDHIDIFLSDNPESGNVYVIDQVDQQTGMYDESKVMYGFNSIDEAKDAYLSNYEEGWKVGVISEVSKEEFKKWIESSTNKIKPFSEYAGVKKTQTEDDGTAKDLQSKENVVAVSELENTTNIEKELRFRETDVSFSDFAAKHKLNEADVKKYAQSMRNGNLGGASYAFRSIQRSIRLQNENLSLGQFVKVFSPIKKELYAKFGDIDSLREEYIQREIEERNMMEAAKKRIEEEKKAENERLLEFENMSDQEMDEAYFKALENKDKSRMRDIVNESARRKGYISADEFRMSHRAPSYDEEGIDKSMIDVANNKDNIRDSLNEQMRMNRDKNRDESVSAINTALSSIEKEGKATVTVYRAVPKSIKENNVRNGDWVTLSESYAKQHGNHALEGNYRIIKEDVPAENLYWDGNDINEWGYDDRNDYRYKDTKNNRKLNDLVTRDDKGNVIPPSKRFNSRKSDIRFRFIGSNSMVVDANQTAERLNVPVQVVNSIDEVPEGSAKEAIKKGRKVKGWYSLSDNKVYVYLPNATSMEDVNQTILHEGVAHYGLRQLVGEDRMDDFLDDVFANVTDEVRKKIIDTLPRYGYNSRIATEEYMARMAENGVDVSVWQRIKQAFNSLMRRMGINIKISDNELRYILWRSRQNLDKNKPLDLAKDVAMQYQMGAGNYFREDTDGSIGMYEQSLKGWKYKAQEAYQDSMLALKNLQEVIAKVSGKPIKSFENAYMAENQLSSKNTSEAEVYYKKHYQPMLQEAGRMMKKYGLTQKGIERYMMLAHGIERNVELTFREQLDEVIKNKKGNVDQFIQDFKDEKERLRKLYSGYEYLKELSDYIGGVNDYSATQAILNSMDGEEHDNFQEDALNYVKDFEQTYDVKELWNKTNDATKTTLRKAYDSGMMGKEQYSNVNNMYMYYVPLRGWDEQTAEDVYEYIDSERNPVSSVLKSAKGRKSIPDEIFATIGNMAESAIMQGNRNMMKQSFMSMVINHPTYIATLKKAWYVYDPVKDEWNISMPDIQESDNAETIAEKLKNHEEQMKQLKENGLATQKPNGLNINYRINKNNISQHVVQVKNGGKDYVIYINGNPRAAQAINGLTNPNVEQNPMFKSIATANRWLAANFTTRNPAFVLSNLVRDLIFSNVAVSIKEDGKYSSRFRKNILKAMPVVLRNLSGKPNNTEADRYFQEFIENGGETGYMHLNDVEKYKKKVRKELSKINGEMGSAKMAMDFAIDRLEDFNRWAEDISRFTTYMTSRQMGRSITESVNDAKEVTVNFNKKGAGYKTGGFFGITSGIFRNLYLFFNASVQSLTNFKRLYDKQPVKFYSALGGFMSAGFLMPMINNVLYSIFGGGDDDPYNDLPEWVRRNNLCIYTGNDTFLTIPLPIELRAFYGLGDYAYQLTTGKEKPSATNIAKGTVGQLADLLPLNPTGNEGLKTFMPDIMSPIFEAYVWNQDFTRKPVAKISPFNERDPEWKRVYKGTSGWLVDTSKFLNDISNGSGPGSEFRKGFIDFNPAKVEHLLESYFGGMAKTFNQAGKTIYYGGKSLIEQKKDEDLVMRNVPIANRFLNTVDERNAFSGINTEYFNLRDEMDQFKYELNGVKKSGNKDEYKEMLNSDLYDKYQKYKPYQKKLKKLNDMAKESQGEDRKEIEDMIIETRRELLEEVK